MATREQKLGILLSTLGFDEAMKLAPGLTDDTTGDAAADAAAKSEAALAKAASTNPFVKGPNFSLAEQGRLYKNPATRDLATRLAKAAGVELKADPTARDLNAKAW